MQIHALGSRGFMSSVLNTMLRVGLSFTFSLSTENLHVLACTVTPCATVWEKYSYISAWWFQEEILIV